MIIFYISSSTIPSRRANSIHVINMCSALTNLGYKTKLFIRSDSKNIKKIIFDTYNFKSDLLRIIVTSPLFDRGTELYIAIKALCKFFYLSKSEKNSSYIISRNLFAAFFLSLFFKKKLIYETHIPEVQIIRKVIQKFLLKRNYVYTVVISNALKNIMLSHHKILTSNISIFHDAAFDDVVFLSNEEKIEKRKKYFPQIKKLNNYYFYVGYFGHLYEGRGIEIIQKLAQKNPKILFLVFGGLEKDLASFKINNKFSNLFFMGHLDSKNVKSIMSLMDTLLMPYQKKVSISSKSINTVDWMSPLKMFEYMSVGVPIISSNLSVLKEVLVNRQNSLLVEPENIQQWSLALNELMNNKNLAKKISKNAYEDFLNNYTWEKRAESMLQLLQNKT